MEVQLSKSITFCGKNAEKQLHYVKKMTKILCNSVVDYRQFARSPRDAKNMRDTRNSQESMHEIMWKLTTTVPRFNYFPVHLNFIPYRMRKSLCLVHNYHFYRETV